VAQVHARAEGVSRAGDEESSYVGIGPAVAHELRQLVSHLDSQRVLRLPPVQRDRQHAVGDRRLDAHAFVVRMLTTDTPEPRPPTLCCSTFPRRISAWRSPASRRSCHQHSVSWATPVAPMGWPLASSPPDVLIGMRPSSAVSPSSDAYPPLPFSTNPRSSMSRISVIVKQSWTSAMSMSAGPSPAIL